MPLMIAHHFAGVILVLMFALFTVTMVGVGVHERRRKAEEDEYQAWKDERGLGKKKW